MLHRYIHRTHQIVVYSDILSKKLRLQWIKPNGVLYVSGIRMFFFMIKSYNGAENGRTLGVDKAEKYFEITNDKRWWKIASAYFLRVFHPYAYYKSLKQ